jgi:diguanylate cyclase (GGDEF)-like protein
VKDVPRALRGYLWAIYAACAALLLLQAPLLPATLARPGVLLAAAVFAALTCMSEAMTLQMTRASSQTISGTAHIALILLFPPPLPLFIALGAALVAELPQRRPIYKRAFNACVAALAVGLTSLALAPIPAPLLLRPGHVAGALPALGLLIALYYLLSSAPLVGVLSLVTGRRPWAVWRAEQQPAVLPEVATVALGILVAVVWRFDPLLLALCAPPVAALHAALRTTARAFAAEERAETALVQASVDGLTGLLNHRAFHARLDEEIARAARTGRPLALLMIDLDDFRAVNNAHGHPAGDATLVAIAAAVRASVRTADIAGRYGGDEFAAVLPETDLDEALTVAERTRAAIAAATIEARGVAVRTTTSLGVACLPRHARTRDALIGAADGAAYAAKDAGKDRVRSADDDPRVSLLRRSKIS